MSDDKIKKYNLTQGGIFQKILIIALPVIGINLLQMVYNLADMFWMGRLGTEALAATSASGMYLWLSMGFIILGRMGAEIGVSQSTGSGDNNSAHQYMNNSFFISAVLGLAVGIMMVFGKNILVGFFNIKEIEVVSLAETYISISGIGMPMMFISAVIAGTFTGTGNSRLVFYINSIGIIFNLILDPIMIFGMNMGIKGAAFSNVIGQLLGFILSIWALYCHPHRPFKKVILWTRPHIKTIKQIFKWGLPVMVESLLFPFLSMIITRVVTQWGSAAIAAQRISSQAESLTWLIAGGFCTSVTSFIGQNFGADKWSRIRKGMRISAIMLTVYGIVVTLFLYFCGSLIFRTFTTDEEVISLGVRFLRILSLCQLTSCFESLYAGYFRGIGQTIPPSIINIAGNILRVIAAILLSNTSLGLDGVCWAISLGNVFRALMLIAWFFVVKHKSYIKKTA